MKVSALKTESDYEEALKEVELLMSAELGSPEGDRLDELVMHIDAYERENYPMT